MTASLIRFACSCGKRFSAKAKYAGRKTKCPKCDAPITVPEPKPAAPPSSKKVPPIEKCKTGQLDKIYASLRAHFADRLEDHSVDRGTPILKLKVPVERSQTLRVDMETDADGHEWLVMGSEIGTVTLFSETAEALRMNHKLTTGRLYLDRMQVLQLEHRLLMSDINEARLLKEADDLAQQADEFEETLFRIDVR